MLAHLHAQGQHFRDENILEEIDGQAGEVVGLPEDQAGAGEVRPHDGLSVVQGVLDAPPPKGLVKAVVGVAGEEPDADFGVVVDDPGAQPAPLVAHHVHDVPVLIGLVGAGRLCPIDPGVPGPEGAGGFFVDSQDGIGTSGHGRGPPWFDFVKCLPYYRGWFRDFQGGKPCRTVLSSKHQDTEQGRQRP